MPAPVHKQEISDSRNQECVREVKKENKILGIFENDDIILLAVIIMLLTNDCNDKMLLLALAFVFFNGFDGI